MLICSEPSQTDAPKRAVTVNALSGYDRVLTLLKKWQVLFGLVASVNTLLHFCSISLLFLIQLEATARSGFKSFISPIIEIYDRCQVKSTMVLILSKEKRRLRNETP